MTNRNCTRDNILAFNEVLLFRISGKGHHQLSHLMDTKVPALLHDHHVGDQQAGKRIPPFSRVPCPPTYSFCATQTFAPCLSFSPPTRIHTSREEMVRKGTKKIHFFLVTSICSGSKSFQGQF